MDETLFSCLADRSFITPTDFGHFLSRLHEEVASDRERSRADLTKALEEANARALAGQRQLETYAKEAAEALHGSQAQVTRLQVEAIEKLKAAREQLEQADMTASAKRRVLEAELERLRQVNLMPASRTPGAPWWAVVVLIVAALILGFVLRG